jgi:hypothetical protein
MLEKELLEKIWEEFRLSKRHYEGDGMWQPIPV